MRAAFTPTRPIRTPLLFHRPHRPPHPLLCPSQLPRRSPPKIPRLRPLPLRRSLHHQNRNRNLPRLGFVLCSAVPFRAASFFSLFFARDLIPAWNFIFPRLALTDTKAHL